MRCVFCNLWGMSGILIVAKAIMVLSKTPNPIISSTFTKTVLVTNYFYRIRCEAAAGLVSVSERCLTVCSIPNISIWMQCANQRLDWIGLFHLFKLFLRYCYEPDDPKADLFSHTYVPRPNDFSDIAEYFVRKVSRSFLPWAPS